MQCYSCYCDSDIDFKDKDISSRISYNNYSIIKRFSEQSLWYILSYWTQAFFNVICRSVFKIFLMRLIITPNAWWFLVLFDWLLFAVGQNTTTTLRSFSLDSFYFAPVAHGKITLFFVTSQRSLELSRCWSRILKKDGTCHIRHVKRLCNYHVCSSRKNETRPLLLNLRLIRHFISHAMSGRLIGLNVFVFQLFDIFFFIDNNL